MSDDPVFLYVAAYDSEADARADYEVLLDLHSTGVIGTYDAALVTKDEHGKVHVHKHEKPTEHGAGTGIGVGAVIGLLFPVSLIGSAVAGGTAGGVIAHFWRGLSRGDMKDIGETLDDGQAALVIVAKSKLEDVLERELKRADKRLEKQVEADAEELEKELKRTAAS
jgi:uncharacterized membrane protein